MNSNQLRDAVGLRLGYVPSPSVLPHLILTSIKQRTAKAAYGGLDDT